MGRLSKIKLKLLTFICIGIVALGLVTVSVNADEEKGVGVEGIPLENWMSYLPDDVPISRINMPGSHDSGCWNVKTNLEFWFETQDENISEQLKSGVRVFDVRTGPYEMSDTNDPFDLIIHHSKRYCYSAKKDDDNNSGDPYLRLRHYFEAVDEFLQAHPTETVVLNITNHSDDNEKARKLLDNELKPLLDKDKQVKLSWDRFDYYPVTSGVPKLGAVRGRCVVLLDDDALTAYEDDYLSSSSTKLSNFRKVMELRKTEPETKMSLAKDKFCEQDIKNEPGKEKGEIHVEQNNLNINLGLLEDPRQGSNVINKRISEEEWYSEKRYGWIMMDYINSTEGARNLVRKIINTNQGSTNYYASVYIPSDYLSFLYDVYIEGVADNGQKLTITNEDLRKKYNFKMVDRGYKLEVSATGLPLYAPDVSYYKYALKLNRESFEVVNDAQTIHNEYMLLDGKWSARQQNDMVTVYKSLVEQPLEIKWNYGIEEFTEPSNREDFFKKCYAIVLRQFTDSGKSAEIRLIDYFDIVTKPYLEEFEQLSDASGTYYKTKVKALPKQNAETGELYHYEIKDIIFENIGGIVYKWNVEQGTDGAPRLVIDVRTPLDKTDVIGKTYWNDGNDLFNKQDTAFIEAFGNNKTVKLNMTSPTYGTSSFYSLVKNTEKTDDARCFSVAVRKFDMKGDEYTDRTYVFPEKIGGEHYHYVLNSADGNEAWYDLVAATDLTVVWNLHDGESVPTEYENGITIGLTNGEELTAVWSNDAMIWTSTAKMLPLFYPDSTSYKYQLDGACLDDIRFKYDDFLISTDTIISIDDEGYPERHFVVYIDSVADEVVSGTIDWNDGILDIRHDESSTAPQSKDCVSFTRSVLGGPIEPVPAEDLENIEWCKNHFYGKLPAITMSGETIEYFVEYVDVPGYEKDELSDNVCRYTKLISLSVDGIPDDAADVSLTLYRNGELQADEAQQHAFNDLLIADENNTSYEYNAVIDNTGDYSVDYINFDEDYITGNITQHVEFYKAAADVEIPIKLNIQGADIGDAYRFEIDGITAKGRISDSLVIDSKIELDRDHTEGSFIIPISELTGSGTSYYFSIYQKPGNNESVDYDEHISYAKVTVIYGTDKMVNLEWGEWEQIDDEMVWKPLPDADKAEYTNVVNYIPARLVIEGLKHQSKVPEASAYALPAKDFVYSLSMESGQGAGYLVDVATVSDNADGSAKDIVFGADDNPLEFYEPGHYTMYVEAVDTGISGWLYDSNAYSIDLDVVVDASATNKLNIENIRYDDKLLGKDMTITQIYSEAEYKIPVKNVIRGVGSTTDIFSYSAQDMADEGITRDTEISGAGDGEFPAIKYYEPGEYRYRIIENYTDGNVDWKYDDSVIGYTITVTRGTDGRLEAVGAVTTPTFTNYYTKQPVPIKVYWTDAKDSSGCAQYRPENLDFVLKSDGVAVGATRQITGEKSGKEWNYETEILPQYKIVDGRRTEIEYSLDVDSTAIDSHYEVEWSGDDVSGLYIYCREKDLVITDKIAARIVWDDNNNARGIRPKSVLVELNHTPRFLTVDPIKTDATGKWKVSFGNQPRYILDATEKKVKVKYEPTIKELRGYKVSTTKDSTTGEYIIKCSLGCPGSHTYGSKWVSDGSTHWHECTVCGFKKDEASHTKKTVILTKAIQTSDGKSEQRCSVCNKKLSSNTIYSVKSITLSKTKYTYNGEVKKPGVTVKDRKGNTISSKYYTVTYPTGRKNVGAYTVKITFKERYSGSKKLTFKIYPQKTSFVKSTSGKQSIKVYWNKIAKQVSGYEIQYSTSSTFKSGVKKVTVKDYKTTNKTISNLKSNKKYYVRIRCYKTVNDKKYYSDWSKTKAVTTKK